MKYDKWAFLVSLVTLIITIIIFKYQQKILKKNEMILRRDIGESKDQYC